MHEPFIGRRQELALLNKAYRSAASAFIPIYGRRRVGKSELILHFARGKPVLYCLGKQGPAGLTQRELLDTAAELLREPLLTSLPTGNWKQLLAAVVERWRGPGKITLALDEFQWMAAASPALASVLQDLWDRQWKASGKVLLILCGSYVGFMARAVLGRQSPLFGRRTAQIFLKPFGYQEAAEFHPDYSLTERARTYFVCGGVPLYLRTFNSRRSLEQNLVDSLLDENAPLYREPEFLLREELREVENYYALLLAVASGFTTPQMIAQRSGIEPRSLPYYLHQLTELGYLARRYPLTGKPGGPRQVRYVLDDPLLRFWFRFVYPNTSYIAQRGGLRALEDRIRPQLDSYFGTCFKQLCREALPVLYARAGLTAGYQVGEYWDKNTQIDVVGYRDDGWTDLGECKWGPVRSASVLRRELEDKVAHYPNRRNATIGRHVFTRMRIGAGRTVGAPDIAWHCLEDLYSPDKG